MVNRHWFRQWLGTEATINSLMNANCDLIPLYVFRPLVDALKWKRCYIDKMLITGCAGSVQMKNSGADSDENCVEIAISSVFV